MLRIIGPQRYLQLRAYSIKRAAEETRRYTDTINLPRTKFPARLGATKRIEVEKQLNEVIIK